MPQPTREDIITSILTEWGTALGNIVRNAPTTAGEAVRPDALARPVWRTGRKVFRTIYWQDGDQPGDSDTLIGMMDTAELAAQVVAAVNARTGLPDEDHLRKFPVITICGSMRFWNDMLTCAQELSRRGWIVLAPFCVFEPGQDQSSEAKTMLDRMHLRKIDMSEVIVVVSMAGYVGESTRNEIRYAIAQGKRVIQYEDGCLSAAMSNPKNTANGSGTQ